MTLTSLPVWPNTVWFDKLPSPNSRNRGKTMWPHQPSFPVSINDSGSAFKSVSKRSCSRLSAPVIARTWQGTTKNQHEWISPTPPSIFQDGRAIKNPKRLDCQCLPMDPIAWLRACCPYDIQLLCEGIFNLPQSSLKLLVLEDFISARPGRKMGGKL